MQTPQDNSKSLALRFMPKARSLVIVFYGPRELGVCQIARVSKKLPIEGAFEVHTVDGRFVHVLYCAHVNLSWEFWKGRKEGFQNQYYRRRFKGLTAPGIIEEKER